MLERGDPVQAKIAKEKEDEAKRLRKTPPGDNRSLIDQITGVFNCADE